jgi:hypothetical protein
MLTEVLSHLDDFKQKQRLVQRIKTLDELLRWLDDPIDDLDKIANNIYQKHLGAGASANKDLRSVSTEKLVAISKDFEQELSKRKNHVTK